MRRKLKSDERGIGVKDIWPIISIFGMVAVFLGIMIYVLASILPSLAITNSVTNLTGAHINSTGYTIPNVTACGYTSFTPTAAWRNDYGAYNVSVPLANLSAASATGVITNSTAANYSNVSISYSFVGGGDACEATQSVMTMLINFIPWLGIILLVIGAAIVIGVLMGAFGGNKRV